ncbi:hypothetical protein [Hoyosella subflava]|nr:hypothetical protein [Hoyosella subflava]
MVDRELVEGIDQQIVSETQRILTEWVGLGPGLSLAEKQDQIEREALRLQQMTEAAAEMFEAQALKEWTPPGQTPSFRTKVQARESAWRQAREMVLAEELYSQVTPDMKQEKEAYIAGLDQQIQQEYDRAMLARESDRWKTQNVKPNTVAVRVVDRVWMHKSGAFKALAESLIAQRIEDNQPVPATPHDQLAEDLEAMILDELQANPPDDPQLPF